MTKLNANAATCIDGWTKALLKGCMEYDAEIAEMFGIIMAWINDSLFDGCTMEMLRCGRLVAVLKKDGGIRPITVSSVFLKLLGNGILARTRASTSSMQYAIGHKRGALTVVHKVRRAVVKIDSSNAFNVCQRAVVQSVISTMPHELQRYFASIYVPSSPLVVFGPNEHCIVESEEGIRDSLSAFLFCAVMDKVGREILSTLTQHDISLYMYMDDITLSCLPDDANDVAAAAIQCLSQNGFNPNASKSAILFPDGTLEGATNHCCGASLHRSSCQ